MRATQAVLMASYNRWMNERLYAVCAELSDAARKKDRGAFFGSVHGTLNHLLLADRIWLGRLEGKPYPARVLDEELFADFAELRAEREATDRCISDWASGLTDDAMDTRLHYTSIVNPKPRSYVMWVAIAQFFNHQTHHRGQLTTLLSQYGADYGATDITWMPELLSGH